MAYAKKKKDKPRSKDTRRELQQPDEFMSVTDRVVHAVVGQWKPIAIVLGVTAVVLCVVAIVDAMRNHKEDAAAALLYDAQMELPEAGGMDYLTGMPKVDEEQPEKLREAVVHFDKVVEQYGSTVQADIAQLEAGNALFEAGDYEQAEQRYGKAASSRSAMVRILALNAQAQSLESLQQFDREAEVLRQVVDEADGAMGEYAYLDLIRAHELQGDRDKALAVCREFEQNLPDSPLLEKVQTKIRSFGEEPAEVVKSVEEAGGETT